jgi:hypothetical protein
MSGYLTREELPKLYQECGSYLHRGKAKSVQARKIRKLDFQRIADWGTKICTLLDHHHISLRDAPQEYWIMMQNKETRRVVAQQMHVVKFP